MSLYTTISLKLEVTNQLPTTPMTRASAAAPKKMKASLVVTVTISENNYLN